ncbi:hypothetical protein [uncultured Dokdonia sp.]|uniref:hypothetical protein n=1 Tax=uncultured Dokdonia sp. TaxID=575653 RepID=UPI0030EF2CB3|tara:strand:- start:72035 stop:73546 length:1512 start_codon:yes stop_codon:yes gene_type:complete
MIKFNFKKLMILTFFFIVVGCDDDDVMNNPTPEIAEEETPIELTIEEQQEETTASVTNSTSKTWKITEAILRNSNGEFNISDNFNILDDEFVFKQLNGSFALTWNIAHDVDVDAASAQETLVDYYRAPLDYTLSFDNDSTTNFSDEDGQLIFEKTESSFTSTVFFSNDSQLDIVLSEKTAADYATIPTSGLSFNEITSFNANGFAGQRNVGFVGSYSDNSMFIAHRADCGGPIGANGFNLRSRILKFDIDSATITDEYSSFSDFFTRQLNIINNELILTGGQKVYTYDLSISSEPSEVPYEIDNVLSRYSTSVSGSDIYIVGGDLDEQVEANKIRKINTLTGDIEVVATMPGSKIHAGSEIVNDKLYIFSGRQKFNDNTTVTTASYIYNLSDGSFQTFDMPVALYNSYASRNGNLIYIAGDIQEDTDGNAGTDNYDIWMGVYNTLTDEITEITHNLDDTDGFSYIQQLTVFNGKLYVIYGDAAATNGDPDCEMSSWSILEAII